MNFDYLKSVLVAHGLLAEKFIYNSGSDVKVIQGTRGGQQVAVKIVALPPSIDFTVLERECGALIALQHPGIIRLFDCFWANDLYNHFYLILVTELCASDLNKEIRQRKAQGSYWSEPELWQMLKDSVDAFAFMQERGYAHRDIKPDNLFLSQSGRLVLGDFGSSKYIDLHSEATIAGTPMYLSPKLTAGLAAGIREIEHNAYKSDVYSLGIAFLHLTTLEPPIFMLATQSPSEAIRANLSNFSYSEYWKRTLMWLATFSEEDRCDFIQLKTYLNSLFAPAPQNKPNLPSEQPRYAKEKKEVECLWCKNKQDIERLDPGDAVQLDCSPQDHIFCSQTCFEQFRNANRSNFFCPACRAPIPDDLISPEHTSSCTIQ